MNTTNTTNTAGITLQSMLEELDALDKQLKACGPVEHFDAIIFHPDNLPILKKIMDTVGCLQSPDGNALVPIGRIQLRPSPMVPRYKRRWEWPNDGSSRFIEYEDKDIEWAEKLGYGRWVDTTEPAFFLYREPPRIYFDHSVLKRSFAFKPGIYG